MSIRCFINEIKNPELQADAQCFFSYLQLESWLHSTSIEYHSFHSAGLFICCLIAQAGMLNFRALYGGLETPRPLHRKRLVFTDAREQWVRQVRARFEEDILIQQEAELQAALAA
jgi:hypothetical protein